jgi:hypothetical protein
MCVSCECGEPNESHGDSRHITADQVNEAAQAANISAHQVAQNIMQAIQQQGGASSGSSSGSAD